MALILFLKWWRGKGATTWQLHNSFLAPNWPTARCLRGMPCFSKTKLVSKTFFLSRKKRRARTTLFEEMATGPQVLHVYKQLLRNGRNFKGYNVREYIQRRVRDEFKENKGLADSEQIAKQLEKAKQELEVVRRQTIISQLYYSRGKMVIE